LLKYSLGLLTQQLFIQKFILMKLGRSQYLCLELYEYSAASQHSDEIFVC